MRKSHVAVLSSLGVVVFALLAGSLWLRVMLSSATAQTAPPTASSNGQVTRSYDLRGFVGLDFSGRWEVTVTRGDAWQIELSYPQELDDRLVVRVANGTLIVDYSTRGWRNDGGSRVASVARIVMPALQMIDLSGASTLAFSGFSGDELQIDVSGATEVEGRDGRYRELTLDASGASTIDLRDVTVTDASIDSSGASTVTLRMDGGVLSGDLSGAGTVTYYGAISGQRLDISGAGAVRQAN